MVEQNLYLSEIQFFRETLVAIKSNIISAFFPFLSFFLTSFMLITTYLCMYLKLVTRQSVAPPPPPPLSRI